MSQAAQGLLALEQSLDGFLPADIKRILVGFIRYSEINPALAEPERQELIRRVKKHLELGVLGSNVTERFRFSQSNSPQANTQTVRAHTEAGFVTLTGAEMEALRACKDVVQSIDMGAVEATTMMWTGEHNVRAARHGFNKLSDTIDSWALFLPSLFDTAQVLGIDLDSYPNIRKYYESCSLLQTGAGEKFTERVLSAFERASNLIENRVCRSEGERSLLASLRQLRLLENLAILEVTPDDFDELVEGGEDFSLAHVLGVLSGVGVVVDEQVLKAAEEFDAKREWLQRFYECARLRARQMALQTEEHARKNNGKAVLVCLGFHQPTVKETWLAQKVSYLVAMPPFP